jgi:hypothetical protein
MPIIQAGKQFTAADIKLTAGNLASMIVDHCQSGQDFGGQLGTMADADLIALGLTQPEIDTIKGFYGGELPGIITLIKNSFHLRSLLGLGV